MHVSGPRRFVSVWCMWSLSKAVPLLSEGSNGDKFKFLVLKLLYRKLIERLMLLILTEGKGYRLFW